MTLVEIRRHWRTFPAEETGQLLELSDTTRAPALIELIRVQESKENEWYFEE